MLKNYNAIAAISSPPGKGGVAIIRISGEDALPLAAEVFFPASGKSFLEAKPRMQTYGYIIDNEEKIDDVLATYFPAPHSYTGENIVEIGCHGGILVTSLVLEAFLKKGARAAEAGEFTKRAFINGRLSLTEAEAIGNLLEAESREQVKLASAPSRRKLGEAIGNIRGELVSLMSSIYARIDYPDEDLGDYTDGEVREKLISTRKKAEGLRETYKTGRVRAWFNLPRRVRFSTWFTRLDLPEPDTPVTQVRVPKGISTSISFKLFSVAPRTAST